MATQYQIDEYKKAVEGKNQARATDILGQAMQYSSDSAKTGALWDAEPAKPIDPYAEIKRQQEALLQAQKQARINALSGQRQSAMSALGQEESKVAPMFLQQRGNLSTTAQQTARSAEQALAARGLTRGGSAVQGDIARNVALQQGMSNIGTAEAGTLADIQARRTQAEQAYAQGVAQAESEAAAQAAQTEIARLMQAQQAQEATVAKQAEMEFEMQKSAQAFENAKTIENLRIAADEARAAKDFDREKELNKQRSDLEKEQIRLTASLKPKSGGGGGGLSASLQNTMLNQQVDEVLAGIAARSGDMTAEEYNALVLQRLRGISDPNVRARVERATGVTYSAPSVTSYPVSGPSGTGSIPSWLNTRNLPGLG